MIGRNIIEHMCYDAGQSSVRNAGVCRMENLRGYVPRASVGMMRCMYTLSNDGREVVGK